MTPRTLDMPLKVEAEGLVFTECPRWHAGRLVFSDMRDGKVRRLNPADGKVETLLEIADHPAGLGFLPDGDLLVVSMRAEKLLRLSGDGSVGVHADLRAVAGFGINDMVVDRAGRAYVSQFGYEAAEGGTPVTSRLIVVEPDGGVGTGPDELMVANGMILTEDGRTLICAESAGERLSAYDVAADGALSNRRVFAQLPPGHFPDGICLDAEGGVWVACCIGPGFIRVVEGGAVTDFVPMPEGRTGYACMLGGVERRTLFMCTSEPFDPARLKASRAARIESIPVAIPGIGLP